MSGRLLTIGDIHGCASALDAILKVSAPEADETVVILGDVIDRGPDTPGVIERLLDLERRCRLVLIQGNHEEQFFRSFNEPSAFDAWMLHGGAETLAQYGGRMDRIPEEHVEFLQRSVDWFEQGTALFAHAGLAANVPLVDQSSAWLRWIKHTPDRPVWQPEKTVYVGHTPQKSGLPLATPGWCAIDTWAYGALRGADGWLTCLDVGSGTYWQTREEGGVREGKIEQPPTSHRQPPTTNNQLR
jgi:serine/threonine protein phosphatase 1